MAKHVVGKAEDVGPGMRKVFEVRGRPIVIFNVHGDYFALLNRCPHQSAELSMGLISGIATADEPGHVQCSRRGEFIRCPWHGWEFDIRTGQSWCDPGRISVKQYPVSIAAGAELVEGPYKAETFPVSVEDSYLVVDL
ncbi:Rieske (2Fe-2S) protein [Mesorhizobium sp.]|uniref:Rieske (2Fe-2S) protein n=1 Tax=Mesorhizobium sp. TaxID=1871066 RepID=UPI000FE6F176|nr:Rieske (2Fe-2S) protein [Mesorhizobium sp.]RWI89819.1 MAG: Rieske (2Fe-2S) protein [Mesorhizobium sp.]